MGIKIVKNIDEANCITHGGTFHSDDVFATVFLEMLLDNVSVIRVMEANEFVDGKITYDIGRGKFDHHQQGGNGERENGIKYASIGLLWKEYGRDLLNKLKIENVEYVWNKMDEKLISYIDANDNGQTEKINQKCEIVELAHIISDFNKNWDEDIDQDERFFEATKLAKYVFENRLRSITSKSKALEKVEKAIAISENKVLILDEYMPWKEILLNSKNEKAKEILYVVMPSNRGGYSVNAVPVQEGSFENRKSFPENWGGKQNEELANVTGVKTARFCHNARFLCTADERDDAILLAKKAVEE